MTLLDNGQAGLRLIRMRGSFAAACAAVLVGLSPAGALPFASYAASAVCQRFGDNHRNSSCQAVQAEPRVGTELRWLSPKLRLESGEAQVPSIFRSPSGPAP